MAIRTVTKRFKGPLQKKRLISTTTTVNGKVVSRRMGNVSQPTKRLTLGGQAGKKVTIQRNPTLKKVLSPRKRVARAPPMVSTSIGVASSLRVPITKSIRGSALLGRTSFKTRGSALLGRISFKTGKLGKVGIGIVDTPTKRLSKNRLQKRRRRIRQV